ncbi:MAG TPA: LamG-like jellyroll fold domain-containing protein [Parafilimonas sp.]|nr:LamG-like jellyroll fold domain-containing protein [Parafilimonas sp.]
MKKIFTIVVCYWCFQTILYAQPGALDTSFANGGKFLAPDNSYPSGYVGAAYAMALQPDGKIIMAGDGVDYSNAAATVDFAIVRLNADGTPDNSFSNDGKTFVDFSLPDTLSNDYATDIVLQPDGKIIVVGYANDYYYNNSNNTENYYDMAIARLNPDGTLDNSFNGNGKKLIDLSNLTGINGSANISQDLASSVILNQGGKIIIAGYTFFNDSVNGYSFDLSTVQLNTDGSYDNNYDNDGIKINNLFGSDESSTSAVAQPDGKIVVAGTFYSHEGYIPHFMVARLNTNGTFDSNFNDDGIATVDLGSDNDYVSSVALQDDGAILVGGSQEYMINNNTNIVLIRFTAAGSLDNSFNGNGIHIYSQPNEVNAGSGNLIIQKDGKIIQAGGNRANNYLAYSGAGNYQILRYNTDGSLDDGFGAHGRSIIDFGNWTDGFEDFAASCVIQPDGKIIAGGFTGNGNSNSYMGISAVRLLINGKHVTIDGPGDQTAQVPVGECTAIVNNIDPVITPSNLHPKVYYQTYGATTDSGVGTLSGKKFNAGTTTAVYSLASNPLQRAYFNVTATGGTPGGALDFDGIDDFVDLKYMYPIQGGNYGQYSFEAWIKLRAYTNDDGLGSWIFGDERNLNGGIQVQLDTEGYVTTFHPNVGIVKSSYKVPLNTWTHIAFVQSNTELNLYVNGSFVQTLLTSPNLHYADYENFMLGAFTSDFVNYTRHFNGKMDEVRVWDRAICPSQIQNNLHCEIADYTPGLVAYYKFNQGIAGCKNLTEVNLNNDYGDYGTMKNFALSGPTSNWVKGYITGSCAPFTPLSLTCPDPITVNLDSGQCSAIVNFTATAVAGCGSNVTITYSQEPGTYFYPGTTDVYVTATDDFGNQQNCSFPVTVTENVPPVLITKDTTIALTSAGYYFLNPYDLIASLTDNCGLSNVSADAYYFDCNSIGSHLVTVYATDVSGNTASGTATVTIAPFVTTSFVTVNPAPVQYSDVATFTSGIIGAASYYYGCIPATDVTFKVGQINLGTVGMADDGYGNLIATLNKQITKGFLDSLATTSLTKEEGKVTAIFNGGTSNAVQFKKKAFTQLPFGKEDVLLEYTGAKVINTQKTELTIPVSVRLTDIDDGYRGDVTNASVTFTIEPITPGAVILSANSKTTSDITLLNKDHTRGIAQEKFKVALGGNQTAKFRVIAKPGNLYKNQISASVIISTSATSIVTNEGIASSDLKLPGKFEVTAMPNPSYTYFNLNVKSPEKIEKLSISVMDIAGRVVESKTDISVGESIQLGKQYKAGTYLVEIRQGQNIKVLKLVKL